MHHSSRSIVVWGPKHSGKTLYVASLIYWADQSARSHRYAVLPSDPEAAEWVTNRVYAYLPDAPAGHAAEPHAAERADRAAAAADDIFSTVPSPLGEATPAVTTFAQRLRFTLYQLPPYERPRSSHRASVVSRAVAELVTWDVPGEMYTGAMPLDPRVRDDLARALGIVLLVDPSFEPPGVPRNAFYLDFFDRTLGAVRDTLMGLDPREAAALGFDRREQRIPCPVAVCLSKVDRQEADVRALDGDDQIRARFEEAVGPQAARVMFDYLSTRRTFALVSATGRPLRRDGEREVLAGTPDPVGVLDPIHWILGQSGVLAA